MTFQNSTTPPLHHSITPSLHSSPSGDRARIIRAVWTGTDFKLTGALSQPAWQNAVAARIERQTADGAKRPELSTAVRILWSDNYLYLGFEAPFTTLNYFEPANPRKKRIGLWERDVVEAFIGPEPQNPKRYAEFEVAPNGEWLDLMVDLPEKDFDWTSRLDSAVRIESERKLWRTEMRIPLESLSSARPEPGTRWRLNLYRYDRAENAFLAWNPTFTDSFHVPERFGWVEFGR